MHKNLIFLTLIFLQVGYAQAAEKEMYDARADYADGFSDDELDDELVIAFGPESRSGAPTPVELAPVGGGPRAQSRASSHSASAETVGVRFKNGHTPQFVTTGSDMKRRKADSPKHKSPVGFNFSRFSPFSGSPLHGSRFQFGSPPASSEGKFVFGKSSRTPSPRPPQSFSLSRAAAAPAAMAALREDCEGPVDMEEA